MDAELIGLPAPPLTAKKPSEQPTSVKVSAPVGRTSQEQSSHWNQQSGSGDFGDLLLFIWQRKLVLAAFVAAAMVLCAAVLMQVKPVYTAQGVLLVGASRARIVDLEAVISGISAEVDAVESEIELLRAPELVGAVVDELSLDRNREFNSGLRLPTVWEEAEAAIADFIRPVLFNIGPDTAADIRSPQKLVAEEHANVVHNVVSRLSVSSRERSRLLDVAFTSEDAALAARIANTILDLYIEGQVEKKYTATLAATEWLSRNVTAWQRRISEAEKKIEKFRSQADLLEGEHGVLLLRRISETADHVTAARLARAVAEARLRQIEEYKADATLAGSDEFSRLPGMQRLREREAELMATEADMLTKYGPDHARVANVRAELRNLRLVMSAEISRITQLDVATNKATEQALSEILEQLKQQIAAANIARVELEGLRREVDANRRILEVFTSRLAEMRGQADRGILQPDASIIARATVPREASYPKPKLYFALALVLAIGAGLLFIFLTEWLRRGFCTGDEVERATGVPVLGLQPRLRDGAWLLRLPRLRFGARSLSPFCAQRRSPAFERSIRWLGTSSFLLESKPRSLLVTSAKTVEGTTTAAVALARLLAQDKNRVVVVDADLCRPRIHEAFGTPASPGVSDLLLGTVALDAVLHKSEWSGIYTVSAGTVNRQARDDLSWSAIEPLLIGLSQNFDLIVIDGPPILEAPETRLLSKLADATVLVVRWAKTDRRAVAASLEQIEQSGGYPAGILLSMVDRRKYARYRHRDSHRFLFARGRRCAH